MSEVAALREFLDRYPRVAVVTGAGCSTESGIGDYRDSRGRWKHSKPVQYADFMASLAVRRRYWSRSLLGWPQFAAAEPNDAHRALVRLERSGCCLGLITQNVDGLHQDAGHQQVLDLHGRLDRVSCQDCGYEIDRALLQEQLIELNGALVPDLKAQAEREALHTDDAGNAPDGDANLSVINNEFEVPECLSCRGILKPNVVFYGQSVPKPWVEQAYKWVEEADALLVVGSSLMVFSSFRFCRAAAASDTPIAILNRGVTRADDLATLKLDAACGTTLSALVADL